MIIKVGSPPTEREWGIIDGVQRQIFCDSDCIKSPHNKQWWLAKWNRRNVGFCSLQPAVGYSYAFLPLIGILSTHRGKGLTHDLIKACKQYCRSNGLDKIITYIHPLNHASLNAFTKEGFRFYSPDYQYVGDSFLYLYLTI